MRLIDADALLNDSSIVYHTEFGDAVVDVEDIKKAPTITIPIAELDTTNDFADKMRDDNEDHDRI